VERARTPDELAAVLNGIFEPVAPTARIYTSGHPLPPPLELAPSRGESEPTYVGWIHHGVKLDDPQPIYARVRATSRYTPHAAPSELHQRITAGIVRGKILRVRASARAELSDPRTSASVVITAWIPSVGVRVVASAPVARSEWGDVDIAGEIPDVDRMQIHVGLRVTGDGKAWIDDVTASVAGTPLPLEDGDFEVAKPGEAPAGWLNEDGYARASEVRPHRGARCGEINSPQLPIEPLPTPARTLHVVLAGGVEADVPLTLYVDRDGRTLPLKKQATDTPAPMAERRSRYSASDRAVRLADVALAWNVFEHFYPYFDAVQVDWMAELRAALARAMSDTDTQTFHVTLKRLVAALHDGHGLVSFEETSASRADTPARAGMPIGMSVVERQLVVRAVAPGAGEIRIGDVVVSIAGVPALRALAATGEMISAATPQWLALREALVIDFGPKDEPVDLTLKHVDGSPYAARLVRTEESDVGRTRVKPEKISELEPGIMYIDLDRITDDDFDSALPKLAAARGVIFDLRGYPKRVSVKPLRHLTAETLRCPPAFILKTMRPDREGVALEEDGCALAPLAPRFAGTTVFLTDAQAISYAETYMSIVEAYNLSTIVGETTAGTNGNVNSFVLPGGYRVKFTGTKTLKHDGSRHHGVGIAPTVACAPTIAGIAAGRDEVLECGLRTVRARR
jgi:C-terminal processing protease CtpA/Prc